jgi:very-short-patch-repair endonuclease
MSDQNVIVDCVAKKSTGMPARLGELARLQRGIVSRRQAIESGMSADAVKWAIVSGKWQQVYPGVYATFSGQASRHAQFWAALLFAGDDAILSHETAAELISLTDRKSAVISVTVPNARRVAAPRGIVIYRQRHRQLKWRFARGIPPHTLTEDTVIDLLNASAAFDDAVAWVTAAFARRLTSERMLRQAVAARSRVRWRGQLDDVITLAAGGTHSVLEFRYDRDVERAHGLPRATRQSPFIKRDGSRGYRDRFYEHYGRLVIELDGRNYHLDETRDRTRDNQATATGGSTLRYTWTDVTSRSCETAAEVHRALRERGYPAPLKPCSPACRVLGYSTTAGQPSPDLAVADSRPRA